MTPNWPRFELIIVFFGACAPAKNNGSSTMADLKKWSQITNDQDIILMPAKLGGGLMLLKFFTNSEATAYLRCLAEECDESTNSFRHERNNLSKAGYLVSQEDGRTIRYRANTNHPLHNEVRNLGHKSLGIDKIIDQILILIKRRQVECREVGLVVVQAFDVLSENSRRQGIIERNFSIVIIVEEERNNSCFFTVDRFSLQLRGIRNMYIQCQTQGYSNDIQNPCKK